MSQKYMSSRSFASLNILGWIECHVRSVPDLLGLGGSLWFAGHSWGGEKIPGIVVPLFVSVVYLHFFLMLDGIN